MSTQVVPEYPLSKISRFHKAFQQKAELHSYTSEKLLTRFSPNDGLTLYWFCFFQPEQILFYLSSLSTR